MPDRALPACALPARATPRLLAPGLACALILACPLAALQAQAAPAATTAQTSPAVPFPQAAPGAPAKPSPSAKPDAPSSVVEPAQPAGPAAGTKGTDLALACKDRALSLLKQRSPSIEDIFIDMDGLTIAEADLSVGNTKIRNVLMGEAYIQRDRSDKVHRFLCLTGEGDTVLLTFLTER